MTCRRDHHPTQHDLRTLVLETTDEVEAMDERILIADLAHDLDIAFSIVDRRRLSERELEDGLFALIDVAEAARAFTSSDKAAEDLLTLTEALGRLDFGDSRSAPRVRPT